MAEEITKPLSVHYTECICLRIFESSYLKIKIIFRSKTNSVAQRPFIWIRDIYMDTRKSNDIQQNNEKIILKAFGEAVLFIKDL